MTFTNLVTAHRESRGRLSDWWMARCAFCKTPVTRYDHSREEALEYGKEALIMGEHRCPGSEQRRQGEHDAEHGLLAGRVGR